ncbi:unnamed protein product [Cuscuta campestris]|uniref:Retrotransposon gag domain-containing protein n=1 Tax=Cuscuta campestris TaxID=132261 RepID=A0A484LBV5_9ASTE|nr:unnamed protein product [Cuscuta campestris]
MLDRDRLQVAEELLTGTPRIGWEQTKRTLSKPKWSIFVRGFIHSHIPLLDCQLANDIFFNIKQGNGKVHEFEEALWRYSALVPDYATSENTLCGQFITGMNSNIRRLLGVIDIDKFKALVFAAEEIETILQGKQRKLGATIEKGKEQATTSKPSSRKRKSADGSKRRPQDKEN